MTEDLNQRREAYARPSSPSVNELRTMLNKAYLSGNGAEVERVMTMLAEAEVHGRHRAV